MILHKIVGVSAKTLARLKPDSRTSARNAGNIFFALFAAVAMVGAVGYGFNSVIRGPISAMSDVTKRTVAENSIVTSSRLAISGAVTQQTSGGDCDDDTMIEPLPYRSAGASAHPTGGGYLPTGLLPDPMDPWKTEYGYCAWDSGSVIADPGCDDATGRLAGSPYNNVPAIAIISAGKDRKFQTTCNAYVDTTPVDNLPDTPLVVKPAGSDDVVLTYTYAEANNLGNGLWTPSADPLKTATTTTTPKNIEVGGGGSFTGKVVMTGNVLTGGGLVLPDQNSTGACDNAANDRQIRRNTSTTPPTLEICDFTGGLDWTPISGSAGGGDGNGSGGLTGTMVGRWKLDETSGTVAHDELQIADGTLIGSPTWEGTGGAIGGSLLFTGTPSSQSVEIPRSKWHEPTAITVSAWIKPAASQPDTLSYILEKGPAGGATSGSYNLRLVNATGLARFAFRTSSTTSYGLSSAAPIPANTWTHIVGTYDPAAAAPQQKLYVNGTLTASGTIAAPILYTEDPNNKIYLSMNSSAAQRFNGSIDDVRIYNYGLTADQIQKVYLLGVPERNMQTSKKPGRLIGWGTNYNYRLGQDPAYGGPGAFINGDDFIQASVGYNHHSCAVKKDRTVWCWGDAANGRLGNGITTGNFITGVQVPGITDAVEVAAVDTSTCVLRKNGSVWCWGANTGGVFGNGTTSSSLVPIQGPALTDFISLRPSMGAGGMCGVRADNTLWCWGNMGYWGFGDGVTGGTQSSLVPKRAMPSVTDIVQFASGARTCGLKKNGTLYCYGSGGDGALGYGTTIFGQGTPVLVSNITDFIKVDIGYNNVCGLRAGGTIWCWGDNSYGQLGNGALPTDSNVPVQVSNITDFKDVATGNYTACGVRQGGEVWCWGKDDDAGNDVIGDGPDVTGDKNTPIKVAVANVTSIFSDNQAAFIAITNSGAATSTPANSTANGKLAVGMQSSCAIRPDGSLWCWGSDTNGMLGNGAGVTADQPSPYPVGTGNTALNWVSVSGDMGRASGSHFCGIKSDGSAWCWGIGVNAQLGNGASSNQASPVQVTNPTAGEYWSIVKTGNNFSCGIKNTGTLWCWGDDVNGKQGNGAGGNSNVPVQVGTSLWKTVDLGQTHACGIKSDNTLWCWGQASNGRLGNGTTTPDQQSPIQVGTNTDWIDVNVGSAQSCAIKRDGTAWCWGRNTEGQLGISGTTGSSITVPTMMHDMGPWLKIAAGTDYSNCGIKMDGSLWCWGEDEFGRLGNGTTLTAVQSVPYPVDGSGTWQDVVVGEYQVCGVKSDDSIWCWGSDSVGNLGNGATVTAQQESPYPVSMTPAKAKFIDAEVGTGSLAQGNMALSTQGFVDALTSTQSLAFPGSGQTILRNSTARMDLLLDAQEAGFSAQMALVTPFTTYGFGENAATGSFGFFNGPGWVNDHNSALEIANNGNVGIGTNGAPEAKLDVAGGIKLTADATCNGTKAGALAYNSGKVQYCDTTWKDLKRSGRGGEPSWDMGRKPISGGQIHTCGIQADGTLWCWGGAYKGQLGNGTTTPDQTTPVKIGTSTWTQVSAEALSTCGIQTDFSLWCWGYAGLAQPDETSPVKIGTASWTQISSTGPNKCGIRSDGTLWCWGANSSGQIGNGQTTDVTTPLKIGTASWTQISTGGSSTCGIQADGSLWCWGSANYGQLGNGTTTPDQTTPLKIGTALWIKIKSGGNYTCGIQADSSLWCWGYNEYGKIGNGVTGGNQTTPVKIGTASWMQIELGGIHTCGIQADGSLWCWGYAYYGGLGNGSTSPNQNAPVKIGTSVWTQLATGLYHTCGIQADSSLWCWGQADNGRLGNGSTTPKQLAPIQVQ